MSSSAMSKIEVCESLIREHRFMESLLEELEQAIAELQPGTLQQVEALRRVMCHIEPEMNTHFACEEQALFPGVSPYHPMVLMEVEHEELIALRTQLLSLLDKKDVIPEDIEQIKELGSRFIDEMLNHIGREDSGIFPTCEQALSDEEKIAIMAKMETIRAEAKTVPTPAIIRAERKFNVLELDLASPAERPVFSKRLLGEDELEIKHLIVQSGQSLPTYWSPKQITLVCLKGLATYIANGQNIDLKPGVCIVMTPQLRHGILAQSDCHLLLLLR